MFSRYFRAYFFIVRKLRAFSVTLLLIFACFLLILLNLNNNDQKRDKDVSNSLIKFAIMPGGDSRPEDAPWKISARQVIETLNDFRIFKRNNTSHANFRFLTTNFNISPGQGNLMFIYAALYALSKRLNCTLLIPEGCLLRRSFYLQNPTDHGATLIISDRLAAYYFKKWPRTVYHQCCRYDRSIDNLTGDFDQVVLGYFQSYKYFHGYDKAIRRQFNFLEPIVRLADESINQALFAKNRSRNNTTLIGVHVRRGVDLTWNTRNQVHGHVVAPKRYFLKAMDYFRSKYNVNNTHVLFLVTSDDPFWCRQNLIVDDVVIVANSIKTREVDLAILAKCQHIIMSTGTFSWWAAYLTGGDVTYYEFWPRPGSSLAAMVERTDYFLPNWIPMS